LPVSVRRSMVPSARELRQRETASEKLLWSILRNRRLHGLKFRRQYPVGPFVADFYCAKRALIVELDGPIHDDFIEQDTERTRLIEASGFRVIRFRNDELLNDPEGVLQRIVMTAKKLTPNPSPLTRAKGVLPIVPSPFAEGEGRPMSAG
jgi:very-short-patch-repair endonuclease